MNITIYPHCGGHVRSISIGWKCENCQGFIDMRGQFHEHKEEPFMPPMTNADRIRAMNDEELAGMLWNFKECGKRCIMSNGKHCYQICEEESVILKWLQQPAEEDT